MRKRGHKFEIKQGWGMWECLEGGKGKWCKCILSQQRKKW